MACAFNIMGDSTPPKAPKDKQLENNPIADDKHLYFCDSQSTLFVVLDQNGNAIMDQNGKFLRKEGSLYRCSNRKGESKCTARLVVFRDGESVLIQPHAPSCCLTDDTKILFEGGGMKISRSEVERIIEETPNIKDVSVAKMLVNKKIKERLGSGGKQVNNALDGILKKRCRLRREVISNPTQPENPLSNITIHDQPFTQSFTQKHTIDRNGRISSYSGSFYINDRLNQQFIYYVVTNLKVSTNQQLVTILGAQQTGELLTICLLFSNDVITEPINKIILNAKKEFSQDIPVFYNDENLFTDLEFFGLNLKNITSNLFERLLEIKHPLQLHLKHCFRSLRYCCPTTCNAFSSLLKQLSLKKSFPHNDKYELYVKKFYSVFTPQVWALNGLPLISIENFLNEWKSTQKFWSDTDPSQISICLQSIFETKAQYQIIPQPSIAEIQSQICAFISTLKIPLSKQIQHFFMYSIAHPTITYATTEKINHKAECRGPQTIFHFLSNNLDKAGFSDDIPDQPWWTSPPDEPYPQEAAPSFDWH